ncbi:MAG: alpha-L-fucosidase [bacterium]
MIELPFRQVHLDFHTSPLIPDVGIDFDPEEFAKTLKESYVNSITVFAKCHHGMSYYPTKVGVMHPSLKRDLLGEMVEACHKENIRVCAYISVVWDEYSASNHGDWLQVNKDGTLAGRPPFGNRGWRFLCMNSPYVDYVAEQTEEVLKLYDVDGVFFDIVMQTYPGCVCNHCMKSMKKLGLDPTNDADLYKHSQIVGRNFMSRMDKLVKSLKPEISVFYNSRLRLESDFELGMGQESGYFTHFEIESLPSGGWGYNHFPLFVRYYQTLGKDLLGMTGRFHKSWADFGGFKNRPALEYECFTMLSLGAKCSIGDQLHPRGKLDKTAYNLIGSVYKKVAEREEWCKNAKPLSDIGVLISSSFYNEWRTDSDEGAMRMLSESHYQFSFIDSQEDLNKYKLIIAPDRINIDKILAEKIKEYLKDGGKLIVSYKSGLAGDRFVLDELGVDYLGDSDYCPDYFRVLAPIDKDIEPAEYVMYERGTKIQPRDGAQVLVETYQPYFNRTWEHFSSHAQTPPEKKSIYPAVVRNGSVIYINYPIFRAYVVSGNLVYKKLVKNCIDLLLDKPLVLDNAPSTARITVTSQELNGKERFIAHILHYIPERRCKSIDIIEDVIPIYNVKLQVRLDKSPSRCYLAPQMKELDFVYNNGYVDFTVPKVDGYQIVVLE